MRAGRTLRVMGWEQQDQVIADYAAGRPVADIGAAYGLTQAEIEYLVAGEQQPSSRWSLQHRGNRIALAVVIGWVLWLVTGVTDAASGLRLALFVVVSAAAYAALSYAGRLSSR